MESLEQIGGTRLDGNSYCTDSDGWGEVASRLGIDYTSKSGGPKTSRDAPISKSEILECNTSSGRKIELPQLNPEQKKSVTQDIGVGRQGSKNPCTAQKSSSKFTTIP